MVGFGDVGEVVEELRGDLRQLRLGKIDELAALEGAITPVADGSLGVGGHKTDAVLALESGAAGAGARGDVHLASSHRLLDRGNHGHRRHEADLGVVGDLGIALQHRGTEAGHPVRDLRLAELLEALGGVGVGDDAGDAGPVARLQC